MSSRKNHQSNDITITYSSYNQSPRLLKISRNKVLLYLVGLPLISLIALVIGFIGLIHTSPFHLISTVQDNIQLRKLKNDYAKSKLELNQLQFDKQKLINDQTLLQSELKNKNQICDGKNQEVREPAVKNCPAPKDVAPMASPINLSTLSLFKPQAHLKDKTKPASLKLEDFKGLFTKENLSLQFNIVNLLGGDVKLAGHIIVVMKSEESIQVYPANTLLGNSDFQINYSAGEPFATQRFRPVNATFRRPKKPGTFHFTVFIFAKNGDLLHFQNNNINFKY